MAAGDLTATVATLGDLPCTVFDGVDDYVEVAHSARQLGANLSNGFTISAWINPTTIGESSGRILDKSTGTDAEDGFRFNVFSSGAGYKPSININHGTGTSQTTVLDFGIWYHVLITVSSGQLATHYLNGVLNGTADQDLVQTISTITTTNAMRIGNRATATDRTFDGGIREVKMWDKVLTADEIADDYNKGGFIAKDNLIHYFHLFDKDGESVGYGATDFGQVGVTATVSGAYFTNYRNLYREVSSNVNTLNLPAVTDKLVIVPRRSGARCLTVVGVARAAA